MGELTLELAHLHLKIAAQRHGNPLGPKLLALHGWLDNSESFTPLAPYLSSFDFVAIDLPGHGFSSHLPAGCEYHYADYVHVVAAIVRVLQWNRYSLLGHSLGAGIAPLVAGTFPDEVEQLILIEGIGPLTTDADDAPQRLQQGILSRFQREPSTAKPYESLAAILRLRQQVGHLEESSARLLLERNLKSTPQGWVWRTDARLKQGTLLRMTEELVAGFLKRITCPTLLIKGDQGYLTENPSWQMVYDRHRLVKNISIQTCPGRHHLHMDKPVGVADVLQEFLQRPR